MDQGSIDWRRVVPDEPLFIPEWPPIGAELEQEPQLSGDFPFTSVEFFHPLHAIYSDDVGWYSGTWGPFMGFSSDETTREPAAMIPASLLPNSILRGYPSVLDDKILDRSPADEECDNDCERSACNDYAGAPLPQNDISADAARYELDDAFTQGEPEETCDSADSAEEGISAEIESNSVQPETLVPVRDADPFVRDPLGGSGTFCPTGKIGSECFREESYLTNEARVKSKGKYRSLVAETTTAPPVSVGGAAQRWLEKVGQKRNLRGMMNFEFSEGGDADSDSDYTPGNRKKKAKKSSAAKPSYGNRRNPTSQPQWEQQDYKNARVKSVVPVMTETPSQKQISRDFVSRTKSVVEYVPTANMANFAKSANSARYALKATNVVSDFHATDESFKSARKRFLDFEKAFTEKRMQYTGSSNRTSDKAVFADRATRANFARQAATAEFLI